MKHQLQPNTYTICENPEQCKELFDWAKENGVSTYMHISSDDTIISFNSKSEIVSFINDTDKDIEFWTTFKQIPLPEFIARLKGTFKN